MMLFLIFSLILLVAGIAVIGKGTVTIVSPDPRDQRKIVKSLRPYGALILVVGLAVLALDSFTIVPTKNIGVTVAFGKPIRTLPNGFHLVAPWESVVIYDATIQTPDLEHLPVFDVRIADGMNAKMRLSVDWQLEDTADVTKLHRDWRSFDALEARVVNPRLFDALNRIFGDYDPLKVLKAVKSGDEGQLVIKFDDLVDQVRTRVQSQLPAGIQILRLQIPYVEWPAVVQEAVSNFKKELGATRAAEQQRYTAEALKLAIDALNQAHLTPEAFAQQCLIMTERLANQGKIISQTWSCVAPAAGTVALK